MYFAIESQCTTGNGHNGDKLYVTDAYPEVTVTPKQEGKFRDDQLWEVLYNPNNAGASLRNKESKNLIAVPAGNKDALLVENTIENQNKLSDPSALLNIIDGTGSDYKIIRGLLDQKNNLNLAGNDNYIAGGIVKFWGWDGKDSRNYMWKFVGVQP